jgi:hypothetical protein
MNYSVNFEDTQLYTTGAFIRPIKVGDKYIGGVVQFNDDTFDGNGDYCSPVAVAEELNELFVEYEDNVEKPDASRQD